MAGMKGKSGGWNKGLKGYTNSGSFKKGYNLAKENIMWKGDQVGYGALHKWIARVLGTPQYCENCKTSDPTKKYQWANISGEYKRIVSDWKRLCMSCHFYYDNVGEKMWNTRKAAL